MGARRVANLYANSETLATQGVSVAAGTYTVSFTGTGTITFSGAYSGSLVGTGASNRVETTFSASAGTLTSTISGSVLKAQCENVTGQAVQTSSEYVSNGVLSFPYHGAGADGVKYFSTKLDGSAIPDATLNGYFAEGQRTNLVTYSEQFDNAAWTKANTTVTANSLVSPDGSTTADTLTAASSNGTILQTKTSASAAHTFSIWLKRKTGTGNIDLTLDGGTTWTTKTITLSWARYDITQTLANPSSGIRIATSGDEIYAWGGQLEQASFASSYIPTTSATVTRNTDSLTYPTSGNVNNASGSAYAEVIPNNILGNNPRLIGYTETSRTPLALSANSQTPTMRAEMYDLSNSLFSNNSFVYASKLKVASSWKTDRIAIFLNGASPNSVNSYSGSIFDSNMGILPEPSNERVFGTIRNVKIWDKALSDYELTAMTS